MSNVLIEANTMTAIGNAIRAKDGSSAGILPANMPQKILDIPSGGDPNFRSGEFTLVSDLQPGNSISFEHNLGEIPFTLGFLKTEKATIGQRAKVGFIGATLQSVLGTRIYNPEGFYQITGGGIDKENFSAIPNTYFDVTDTEITIYTAEGSTYPWRAGTYKWFVVGKGAISDEENS